jgi:hypothetical protein
VITSNGYTFSDQENIVRHTPNSVASIWRGQHASVAALSDLLLPLTTGAWIGSGDQVEAIISVVSDTYLEVSRLHVAVWLNLSLLFVLMALLSAHRDLKKKFHLTEALLLEKSIGVHSRNWTATAINLEKKAQEPGDVARSSALTFLHLLDEAAEAWLKGSQWHEALRVTQQLLLQTCHAIGSPGFGENEFRACADLIENKLSTYADLSKASSEAPENAIRFLGQMDLMLSIHDQPARIVQLRDLIAEVAFVVEEENGLLKVKAKAS